MLTIHNIKRRYNFSINHHHITHQIYAIISTKANLLCSQLTPDHPGKQTHSYSFTRSTQRPLFWHGLEPHSSKSDIKEKGKRNGLLMCLWYDMIWYDMIWYDMIWYDMMWSRNGQHPGWGSELNSQVELGSICFTISYF